MNALGMNEVMSIPTGFLVCDAMLKAADVTLISSGCVCAGKYYTVVTGEVAAVTAAVEAAEAIEETQGLMGKSAVIPAPHRDLLRFV